MYEKRKILAFSHIPKAAGQMLIYLLRRNYGVRHLDVLWREYHELTVYRDEDLKRDLHLLPWVRSLAGHTLHPCVPMDVFQNRLAWYAILREPVARYLSQYQYHVNMMGCTDDFDTWMQKKPLARRHVQVTWLAGKHDLEAAKETLVNRFQAVGLMEHFNESLLIIRDRLGLKNFDVRYNRPKNIARKSGVRERIMERFDEYRDRIYENNELDLKLYEWVRDELWPQQVAEYGAERLKRDVEREFQGYQPTLRDRRRLAASFIQRNILYKPVVHVERCLRGHI